MLHLVYTTDSSGELYIYDEESTNN